MNKVPTEIWVAILNISLETTDWTHGEGYKLNSSVIVAMSQVCRHWRNIALSTPTLWTCIFFRVDAERVYPNEHLVSLWLQRSAYQPLRVRLLVRNFNFPDPHLRIQQCLLDTLATIPRWKSGYLDIRHPHEDLKPWYSLEPYINAPAPLLEFLYISITFMDIEGVNIFLPDKLWTTSTCLTELLVDIVGEMWTTSEDGPSLFESNLTQSQSSYNHLTHLGLTIALSDGYAFSWEHIPTIFRHTPNLTSCFLKDFQPRSRAGFTGIGPPVVLQHLKNLYLQADDCSDDPFPAYLDSVLIAPSLETLTIAYARNFDRTSYSRFIDRSSCHLNELHLVGVKIPAEDFLQCMRLSPTLKVIHLDPISVINDQEVCRVMGEWNEASKKFNLVPSLRLLSSTMDLLSYFLLPHSIAVTEMLKRRCALPDESYRAFTTLAIPPYFKRFHSSELVEMCGDPWNLQLISNDSSYESGMLWKRYGGQMS